MKDANKQRATGTEQRGGKPQAEKAEASKDKAGAGTGRMEKSEGASKNRGGKDRA